MTIRAPSWLPWSLCALAYALVGAAIVLMIAGWPLPSPEGAFGSKGVTGLIGVTFATAGALIATRQPANPIGWLMLGGGISSAIQEWCQTYAVFALQRDPTASSGEIGAWIAAWIWVVSITLAANAFLRFPDGRLPSPRWRAVPWFSIASGALLAVDLALIEGPLESYRAVRNPFGIAGSRDLLDAVGLVGYAMFAVSVLLGAAAVVVRFRRSSGEEREQLKWIAYSGSLAAGILIVSLVVQTAIGVNGNEIPTWLENLTLLGFLTIPFGIAIAVLRYRLYDIDLVINKTVVYSALAVFITVVYVAIVVGAGAAIGTQSNAIASAVAAAIVAVAFQPARRRALRLADRLVYGRRATPYEVLSGFSERLGDAYSVDDVLPRMARVLAEGIGAERVGELEIESSHGDGTRVRGTIPIAGAGAPS